jgi:hypothetical protein
MFTAQTAQQRPLTRDRESRDSQIEIVALTSGILLFPEQHTFRVVAGK